MNTSEFVDALKQFSDAGIFQTRYILALAVLATDGEQTISQLQEKTGIPRSPLTAQLKKFRSYHLIRTVRKKDDMRLVYVCLTEAAREAILKTMSVNEQSLNFAREEQPS